MRLFSNGGSAEASVGVAAATHDILGEFSKEGGSFLFGHGMGRVLGKGEAP